MVCIGPVAIGVPDFFDRDRKLLNALKKGDWIASRNGSRILLPAWIKDNFSRNGVPIDVDLK
jgi:hypothetical protein